MTDLRTLLELATDEVESPDLARTSLATAHRRRTRRRGIVAGVAAAVAVGGVIVVPRVVDERPDRTTPGEEMTPPTPTPSVDDGDPSTQPVWDPERVPELPVRRTVLPTSIAHGDNLDPSPEQVPMTGVVLATVDDSALYLLDPDGSWRMMPWSSIGVPYGPTDIARPSISSDGTRVAVARDAGILVVDVTTGETRTIAWPTKFAPPRDNPPGVVWQPGDEGFVVFDIDGTWLVNDGGSREAPFQSYAFAVDDTGPLVYVNNFERRTLVTWAGDKVDDESPFVQCERMVASYPYVACTAGSLQSGRSGPVVVDARSGEILAYAPIEDPNAAYSDNGGLTMLGFVDEDTVVMLVGGPAYTPQPSGARHLVTWDFRTGEFERVATGGSVLRSVAVAPALLE
jgi:hypothetical protein